MRHLPNTRHPHHHRHLSSRERLDKAVESPLDIIDTDMEVKAFYASNHDPVDTLLEVQKQIKSDIKSGRTKAVDSPSADENEPLHRPRP